MSTSSIAIVTGASSGIGLGVTRALLASGYRVVANARHASTAGTLDPSDRLIIVDGDIADATVAASLTRTAVERFGSVDLLVNNAGTFVAKPFTETTVDDYQRLVATNLTGFLHVTQPALRQMRAQGGGHVVTITTSLATQPIEGVSAALSILTKGGLNAITRALAIEYAKDGVRVNAVAPGIVDTPMHPATSHGFLQTLHPIRRLASVDEIAQAVLYLTEASFITGEVLHVDGGAHAGRW